MELFTLENDIHVIGLHVENFPLGIPEAIDKIHSAFSNGKSLPLYSRSQPVGGEIQYFIGVEINNLEVSEKLGFVHFVIESGSYLAQNIVDWQGKVQSIQRVFDELLNDNRLDPNGYCVELYKNDKELVCMVKLGNELL